MISNMPTPTCKICGSQHLKTAFEHTIMSRHSAAYCVCADCGFLCTQNPDWLEEAYAFPITRADTGLLSRNIELSRKVAVLIYRLFNRHGRYLDYAGGYGVFTRLMRDAGFNFYHTDPYTQNLFAAEYEWDHSTPMDGVTCFECFEHLENPMQEIEKILSISKTILFSTELLPDSIPPLSWEYYGFEHGQHISLYAPKTLAYIAEQFGVCWSSANNLHLFSEKPIAASLLKKLSRSANRMAYPFARKTTFEMIARKMRRQQRQGAAR